jgi:hypothetical protein
MVRLSAAAAVLFLSMAGQSVTTWDTSAKATLDRVAETNLAQVSALQEAASNVWQRMPLTQRRAIFVTATPDSYGSYEERQSNVFHLGEKIITYVEPVGYTWAANSDGTFSYGVSADFLLKRSDGKIIGGQEKFLDVLKRSHVRNQELMLVLSLSLSDADPGDYAIEYKLHDSQSNKASQFTQNFTLQR